MTRTKQRVGPLGRTVSIALLAAVAGLLLYQLAAAQTAATATASGGAGEVFALAGQIDEDTYGLYLVDLANQTICIYQYLPRSRKLRLMAARTYRFDVQLDDFNNDPAMNPDEVKKLIERNRRLRNAS